MSDECEQDNHGIRWCRTHRIPISDCIKRLHQRVAALEAERDTLTNQLRVIKVEGNDYRRLYEELIQETVGDDEAAEVRWSVREKQHKAERDALTARVEECETAMTEWPRTLKLLTDERDMYRKKRDRALVENEALAARNVRLVDALKGIRSLRCDYTNPEEYFRQIRIATDTILTMPTPAAEERVRAMEKFIGRIPLRLQKIADAHRSMKERKPNKGDVVSYNQVFNMNSDLGYIISQVDLMKRDLDALKEASG